MKLVMAAATDVGSVRDTNEDFFYYSKSNRLVIVCDGMGGHQSGAVASRIAGKTVRDVFFHSDLAELARIGEDVMDRLPPVVLRLVVAARLANHRLRLMAERDRNLRGMGTTLVALALSENNACVVHVGDSRLYCWRKNSLTQITEDHSLVNQLLQDRDIREHEVEHFRKKNVLTRALGAHPTIKLDVQWFPIHTADLFLLCTDGLHNALVRQEIETLLLRNGHDLQRTADTLVQRAKAVNGSDNITAAMVKIGEVPYTDDTKVPVKITVPDESPRTLAFADRFIKEKYPMVKSGSWREWLKPKRFARRFFAIVGVIIIAVLIYGIAKRSLLFKVRHDTQSNVTLIASSQITTSAEIAESTSLARVATTKPMSGHLVLLQVNEPVQLQRLRNFSGVRVLDQIDANLLGKADETKPAPFTQPLLAGSYSFMLVDSLQSIVYRKEGIRLEAAKETTADSTPAVHRVQVTLPPADTAPLASHPIDTGQALDDSMASPTQNGGQIVLADLQNSEFLDKNIFANDVLIGKVKQFIESGFWLHPGTYNLTIKDSTGRIFYQQANLVVENGDVKVLK